MGRGPNEADTCAELVVPAIHKSGWLPEQVTEQYPVQAEPHKGFDRRFTAQKRRADYVLELRPGVPLIVIEAKRLWSSPGDGIQQAARYATLLDCPFAISTNGKGWVLFELSSGVQRNVDSLPTPEEAWDAFTEAHQLNQTAKELLLSPFNRDHRGADGSIRQLRYYQRRAIHEVLSRVSQNQKRILLVMATGTGKTFAAMQLVWKLWNYRREAQRADSTLPNYRVLYLADRDILVKDPLNKTFVPAFPAQSAIRVSQANRRHSPDLYFATYQALDSESSEFSAQTEVGELLGNYPSDFFDLVIVDECHRGSAREDSAWRGILEHFDSATQLGLTATPVNKGSADTFEYFGNPVYEYSLREGIVDGFLAPYSIRRVAFNVDSDGLEVVEGLTDRSGRELPAGIYGTRDFERRLQLPDRTMAMARVIDRVIGDSSDRAVVFCVDAEHALAMVAALRNLRPSKTLANPEWAVRIMSAERDKQRLLEEFTDPERDFPQVAVTSRLLSTGVDIQDLKYVVIARTIGSVAEFKQIIGRGTRLYPEKGKFDFEIVDFVGATSKFSDPDFDGPPWKPTTTDTVDADGLPTRANDSEQRANASWIADDVPDESPSRQPQLRPKGATPWNYPPPKFVLDGIQVDLVGEGFWVHDTESGHPRLVSYVDWARERVVDAFDAPEELLTTWADVDGRARVMSYLADARIDPARLIQELALDSTSSIDLVDQLLHLAWDLPTSTRAERSSAARSRHAAELDNLTGKARTVLGLLLDLYAARGIDEIASPAIVQLPPLSDEGTPAQIATAFGGPQQWHEARAELQRWLYSA